MMGRLYSLQKRLETEPMPELFRRSDCDRGDISLEVGRGQTEARERRRR
jgi:hypothetical protein